MNWELIGERKDGSKQYRHVSSSLVRELASFGQDFSQYVPENCLEEITKYLVG